MRREAKEVSERRRLITGIVASRASAGRQPHGAAPLVHPIAQPAHHIINLEQQQAQLSKRPVGSSLLFGLQSFVSAIIMLILMTFNGYLILSCAAGSALGYHYFSRGCDTVCH